MRRASKVKQTTRQSNTAHPKQSLFLRKIRVGFELTTLYTLDRVLYSTHITGSMLEVREMDGRTQPYMKGSWGSTSWFLVDESSRDNTTGSLRHCDSIKSPKTQEGRQAGTLYALTCKLIGSCVQRCFHWSK